ncbi:MAG: hypothetical protein ABFS41_01675 [Myxococcota bacterium]
MDAIFRVCGAVTRRFDDVPVRGVRVEAFDDDVFRRQCVGHAITDEAGYYEILFRQQDFSGRRLPLEQEPDLYVTVLDADGFEMATTRRALRRNAGVETRIDVQVSLPTEDTLKSARGPFGTLPPG